MTGSSGAGPAGGAPVAETRARSAKTAQSPPDPWRIAFFAVLALALVAAVAWLLLGSSLLVVRHEEVIGNRLVPSVEVLAVADIRRGTPLAELDTAAVAHRVERIDQVLWAGVSRTWPDTVVITVRERTPELAVASGSGFALIDGHGVTVQWMRYKPVGMPVLTSPPAVLRGSRGVQAAVTALTELPARLRELVQWVTAPTADAVTFRLSGGITVVWGAPGKTSAKVAELIVLMRAHARYYDVSDPATAVTQG